jgi:hypothetical protein
MTSLKKATIVLFISLGLFNFSYAQKFNAKNIWQQSKISKDFKPDNSKKILILPVKTDEKDLDQEILNTAYNQLMNELTNLFIVMPQETALDAVNSYPSVLENAVDVEMYKKLCNYANADLILKCQLTREKVTTKKGELTSIMAVISILDSSKDFSTVYLSKTRMYTPKNKNIEVEQAIIMAIEKLEKSK